MAPDAGHSQHMTSHIFVAVGMWNDVVSWNLRSAKAALKYPTEGSTTMHYVHAMDYLLYGYLQLGDSYLREGRTDDAISAWTDLCKKVKGSANMSVVGFNGLYTSPSSIATAPITLLPG